MEFIYATMRYCKVCEKNTIFKYNKFIGHSECCKCGSRYGAAIKMKEEIENIINKSFSG